MTGVIHAPSPFLNPAEMDELKREFGERGSSLLTFAFLFRCFYSQIANIIVDSNYYNWNWYLIFNIYRFSISARALFNSEKEKR